MRHDRAALRWGLRVLAGAMALGLAVSAPVAMGVVNQPTIRLFPSTVQADLKASAESARRMENRLQGVVAEMEQQLALYKASQCEGAEADPGCSAIKQGLGQTYEAMLGQIGEQLPAVKQSMGAIRESLGVRIRTELGRKRTPRDLDKLLAGDKGPNGRIRRVAGKRGGRMSQLFGQYHKLVSLGPTQGQTMATLAADIYLDASDALGYIEQIEAEIGRAQTLMVVSNAWAGEPTPEMIATVQGVKALLFGELEEEGIPEESIQAQDPLAFDDSDLRL